MAELAMLRSSKPLLLLPVMVGATLLRFSRAYFEETPPKLVGDGRRNHARVFERVF